ncbi:MAG: thermonuclease family protein [Bacteriovoracaceae bacterium]
MMPKLAIFTLFSVWILVAPMQVGHLGLVVLVHDGDSITLKVGEEIVKTRLLYIDAPELSQTCEGQKIGLQAGKTLQALILGKEIIFYDYGRDIYGRRLVEVFYQNQSLNLKMVKMGMSTLYARSRFESIKQKKTYLNAFYDAKKAKVGLHQCSRFEMPWHFRKRQKKVSQKPKLP